MSDVFIGRQPILDRNMDVFAYDLQFHQGLNPNKESLETTIDLIKQTEENVGFQSIAGNHNVILQLPKELIKTKYLPSLDPDKELVLEIPNNIVRDVDVLKSLREIKTEGLSIALDDFIDDESSLKLANISDYVKIDIESHSEVQLKKMLEDLHERGIKVIAEKVETEEMFHYLKNLGFDFFQGYFFTNPVTINGQKLTGNKLTLLQLLAKVNDVDTDFEELSNIISQDVALSHKLLVTINNPASMIPVRVESIADGLKYMGLKRLKFWVNMLMLSTMDDAPKELMITSLMRAKFCELIAENTSNAREKDSYFMVGLFSNLGAFFKVPLSEVVAEMPLSPELVEALVEKKGAMGDTLQVLAMIEQASDMLEDFSYNDMSISEIGNSFMSASAWAHQVVVE